MDVNQDVDMWVSSGVLFETCCGEKYYKYGIHINTNNPAFSLNESNVWRRYSEFCWLRKVLKRNYYLEEAIELPSLPTKGIFRNREDSSFIEERRAGLQAFLEIVLSVPIYRADRALHLFTQTPITIPDIEYNLDGQRHDQIIVFRKYTPRRPNSESKSQNIPMAIGRNDQSANKQEDSPKSSYRSVLKLSTSQPSNSPLSSSNKRVTFCDQIRIITLANAWPAELQGC